MIKGLFKQKDMKFISNYIPNIEPSKYIRHILTNLKREIDSNTMTVRDFNNPHPQMD